MDIKESFSVAFPLPFYLPIQNGLSLLSVYPSEHYTVKFNKVKKTISIQGYPPDFSDITEVEVTLGKPNSLPENSDIHEVYKHAISRIISHVNKIIDAFFFKYDYANIRNISINDLPFVVTLKHNADYNIYITNPHRAFDDLVADYGDQGLKDVGSLMTIWENYPEIFLHDLFFGKSLNSIWNEDFLAAIIELQTSFELFINTSLRVIWTKKDLPKNEIEVKLEKIKFRHKIEHHLSKELDTNLSFDNGPEIVIRWKNDLYELRNGIVHDGFSQIDRSMAFNALKSYKEFRDWLSIMLEEKGYLLSTGKVNLSIFERNIESPTFQDHLRVILDQYGYKPSTQLDIK